MSRAFPCFGIKDYNEAMSYYLDFLGFNVDFEWKENEDAPAYMGISRDSSLGITEGEISLHLTEHNVPLGIGVVVDVEDVQAFHDDLKYRRPKAAGVLIDQPWGKTELHLKDQWENLLIVTSPTI
jgi:hypothetical protein